MKVKRFADAKTYEAANHRGYTSFALINKAEGIKNFTLGLSHFLPGGGAGPDAGPVEKTYTILAGELTVIVNGVETILEPMDSCYIAAGETREIINRGNDVVTMLVAVEMPK